MDSPGGHSKPLCQPVWRPTDRRQRKGDTDALDARQIRRYRIHSTAPWGSVEVVESEGIEPSGAACQVLAPLTRVPRKLLLKSRRGPLSRCRDFVFGDGVSPVVVSVDLPCLLECVER